MKYLKYIIILLSLFILASSCSESEYDSDYLFIKRVDTYYSLYNSLEVDINYPKSGYIYFKTDSAHYYISPLSEEKLSKQSSTVNTYESQYMFNIKYNYDFDEPDSTFYISTSIEHYKYYYYLDGKTKYYFNCNDIPDL